MIETVYVPLDDLDPDPRNPKRHADATIRASIGRFGFVDPIIRDDRTGRILSGHGRADALAALRDQGDTAPEGIRVDDDGRWLVPVTTGWSSRSDEEAGAAIVALNRTVEAGGWDDSALYAILEGLDDLDGVGYDLDDLDNLRARLDALEDDPDDDPDDVDPAPRPDPTAAPGDVWQVGPHRIVCGDATDPDVYDRLLAGATAEMIWTDPPYGVNYDAKGERQNPRYKERGAGIANDSLAGDSLYDLIAGAVGLSLGHVAPGGAVWVAATPGRPLLEVGRALADLDVWRTTIAWVKDRFVLSAADFHPRWEAVLYGWKPDAAHRFYGDRTHDTAWEIPRPARSDDHPTMKPVELVARSLRFSSRAGEAVLDPFAGSGTTLVAAHRTGRVGYGIELEPGYVDVIVARLEAETGETARRVD